MEKGDPNERGVTYRLDVREGERESECEAKRDLEWADIDEEDIEKREQAWRWSPRLEAYLEYNVSIIWSKAPRGIP